MTQTVDRDRSMSAVKRALVAIEAMQAKLDAIEAARSEPLAIIGIACRYPGGADTPEAFWKMLRDGEDAISEVPTDRWDAEALYDPDPDAPGKISTRKGGFLKQIDQFDARFFGISAREARSLDPQQRLLLETSWEALERANCPPQNLVNSATGVYVGICSNDYGKVLVSSGDRSNIDAFYGTSNAISVAAGRVSYALGLRGPSLSVDTACSSSLVAVHLACQSLRNGECSTAVAAGVNILLSPETSIAFSRAHMLDADGRCRTFDASASGYSRGEGCGAIVLKRLSDAERDGDRILACIRGTAINHNGRSSSLMSPNGLAQQAVIRAALENGRVDPVRVSYVEVQGTGTALGEPIEVGALAAVYGQNRPTDRPLSVGTVKTNIGHLEGGAGIASLIKVVLAMQHQTIPPHLNVNELNPYVEWERISVKVSTERLPWNVVSGERRLAGVSAFGFGGTNAHAILEEAPAAEVNPDSDSASDSDRPLHLFVISAKNPDALQQLADKYATFLDDRANSDLANICHTANVGRSHFAHRASAVAATSGQLKSQLLACARSETADGARTGHASEPPKIAFLFSGLGSEYAGMGRQLYETQPVFRQTLERCADIATPLLDRSLLDVLYPNAADSQLIRNPAYSHPALFAFEYALAQLWRFWGIEPTVVLGHGLGEYVAACVAGVFSLEDGLKLAAERGRLLQELSQDGGMATIRADAAAIAPHLKPYEAEVSIAELNGPDHVVLAGRREVLTACLADLDAAGLKTQSIQDMHGLNSPLADSIQKTFAQVASTVTYAPPTIAIASALSGTRADANITTANYWCRQLRQPVRFAEALETLAAQNLVQCIEIGPGSAAIEMGRRCLSEWSGQWLPSSNSSGADWEQLLDSLGAVYVAGATVNWQNFDRHYSRNLVDLPTYAWQKQRYWFDVSQPAANLTVEERPSVQIKTQSKKTEKSTRNGRSPQSSAATIPTSTTPTRKTNRKKAPEKQTVSQTPKAPQQTNPETLAPLTSEAEIRAWTLAKIAEELGVAAATLDPDIPFDSYGLDSVLAIGIASAAKQRLGVEVTPLMLAHYPTIASLAQHLAQQLEESEVEIFEI
ncbi:MAG: beta-ketoacyl synthase N-terminal-like domain-containing protein [Cyanobacteria bacterium J06642_2]